MGLYELLLGVSESSAAAACNECFVRSRQTPQKELQLQA